MLTKVCPKCRKRKRVNKFGKSNRTKDGYFTRCKECYNREKAEWRLVNWERNHRNKTRYRKDNPDRVRDSNLRQKYGISLDEYNKMFHEQGGVCNICERPERIVNGKSKKVAPLAVDHCHDTGKVRGLLCFSCNIALGKFQDSPEILARALAHVTNK